MNPTSIEANATDAGGPVARPGIHQNGRPAGTALSRMTSASIGSPAAAIHAPPALRVVVVDDSADSVDLLVLLLQMEGISAKGYTSTHVAHEHILAAPPDVVITDLNMPVGGGVELARSVKASFPQVLVWAATGADVSRLVVAPGTGLPFDRVFVKPLDVDLLLSSLHAMKKGR